MDKNTLSTFGWIVVSVIIIAILIAFATPFAQKALSEIEKVPDRLSDSFLNKGNTEDDSTSPPHAHNYTSSTTQTATCAVEGIILYNCSCGDSYSEFIPKTDHTPSGDATCTTAQICLICNQELVAAKGHTSEANVPCTTAQVCMTCGDEIRAATEHIAGAEATCTTAQVCTICNEELEAATGHTPSSRWYCDNYEHWHICENGCGTKLDLGSHSGTVSPDQSTFSCNTCYFSISITN